MGPTLYEHFLDFSIVFCCDLRGFRHLLRPVAHPFRAGLLRELLGLFGAGRHQGARALELRFALSVERWDSVMVIAMGTRWCPSSLAKLVYNPNNYR